MYLTLLKSSKAATTAIPILQMKIPRWGSPKLSTFPGVSSEKKSRAATYALNLHSTALILDQFLWRLRCAFIRHAFVKCISNMKEVYLGLCAIHGQKVARRGFIPSKKYFLYQQGKITIKIIKDNKAFCWWFLNYLFLRFLWIGEEFIEYLGKSLIRKFINKQMIKFHRNCVWRQLLLTHGTTRNSASCQKFIYYVFCFKQKAHTLISSKVSLSS